MNGSMRSAVSGRGAPQRLVAGLVLAGGVLAAAGGCSRPYRFRDAEPVLRIDDTRPVPVPEGHDFDHALNLFRAVVQYPAVDALEPRRIPDAGDVNSMDEVPASSWFTPRLGARDLSPEELLRGPAAVGPPEPPITVVKAKSGGGNPGFIVADARGEHYLVKFDPPAFPGLETTTALVVNRLFWGFGYNVPEDYEIFFQAEDLLVDPDGELTREDVDHVLRLVAAPVDGRYRATVSYFLHGKILGAIPPRGVRGDDANDLIPHENRRVLRALRVLGAFVNHTDMRPDNSMDVYVGEPGEGHVVHYLLDFGEAFGGHGTEHGRLWDGYNHLFSFSEVSKNLVTAGLRVEPWEDLGLTPWTSVGTFESRVFEFRDWKETTPYAPIRRSQPADDYWAAKILGAVTREHLETLVRAARYPEEGAAEYVLGVLEERRRKILRVALTAVSPVELVDADSNALRFRDVGAETLFGSTPDVRYDVVFLDGDGRRLGTLSVAGSGAPEFNVSWEGLARMSSLEYVRADVTVRRSGLRTPPPAQFHLRPDASGAPRLVGVVH